MHHALGNTIGKLANGIVDTPVLTAAKSNLRNENPLVIYFIPFRQDNPITKPHSLMFEPNYILNTVLEALNGMQIQPILL